MLVTHACSETRTWRENMSPPLHGISQQPLCWVKKKKRRLQNGLPVVKSKMIKKKKNPAVRDGLQTKREKQEKTSNDEEQQCGEMAGDTTFLHTLLDSLNKVAEKGQAGFSVVYPSHTLKELFRDTWEKEPLLIRRQKRDHYKGLFSTAEFDRILRELVPAALEIAMEEDVEFRKGLPLDYLSYMGVQNSDKHTDAMEFLRHSYPKFVTVLSLPCDAAEEKLSLADLLFEKGSIHTAEPLKSE